ncbi:MAG: protein-methionine-sulfoxide reductase heme-binding subunit MsrQ [Chloroflexota bacterium]
MKKPRFTPLQITMHIFGWYPLAWLVVRALTDNLTVNPIQAISQWTGYHAIIFLTLSLACTPLNTLFGWRELLKRRRALGLYSFMYASLHMLSFVGLDYGFSLKFFTEGTATKPYMLMGITTFLILLPLAVTSFKWWMKRMGSGWKTLHKLVYMAGITAVIHFAWAKKGDLVGLSGDILKPLIFAVIVAILLILRLPPVRRWASQLKQKTVSILKPKPV